MDTIQLRLQEIGPTRPRAFEIYISEIFRRMPNPATRKCLSYTEHCDHARARFPRRSEGDSENPTMNFQQLIPDCIFQVINSANYINPRC